MVEGTGLQNDGVRKLEEEMKQIGDTTKWGVIKAITFREGERYYCILGPNGDISLMPDVVVEGEVHNAS